MPEVRFAFPLTPNSNPPPPLRFPSILKLNFLNVYESQEFWLLYIVLLSTVWLYYTEGVSTKSEKNMLSKYCIKPPFALKKHNITSKTQKK